MSFTNNTTREAEVVTPRKSLRLVSRNGTLTIDGVPVGPIFGGTMPGTNGKLAPEHLEQLAKSGISPEFAAHRGYETVLNATCLKALGLAKNAQKLVPGLLFPLRRADETVAGWQYRPDNPRLRKGKPAKYEMPWRQRNVIDVPPGVGGWLDDASQDLWITEGTKKADCGAARGLCIVAINGVWGWVIKGGSALPDWRNIMLQGRRVILAFDSDVMRNPKVGKALGEFAAWLKTKGARVEYLHLPDNGDGKVGLDDYLVDGHTTADLYALVKDKPPDEQISSDHNRPDEHGGQVRLSHFMAKYHAGQLIHVENSSAGWFYWTGTHWREDDLGRSVEAVKDTLTRAAIEAINLGPGPESTRLFADIQRCMSSSGALGVRRMAESDPAFARSLDQLDAGEHLLNMPNGTLDLRTFTVRDHDPADLITRVTRGRYFGDGSDEIGPVWKVHLDRILSPAVLRYLLQSIGQSLVGSLPEPNRLDVWHGPGGRNGKSKTYEAIIHALGGAKGYGYQADPELLLEQKNSQHPTRLYALRGRRFVVTAEINKGRRMNAALMKELTGNRFINARELYKRSVEIPVTWLLVMVTNDRPEVDAGDMAVWKRMRSIPFNVELGREEQDEELGKKLAAQHEADGILTSLVDGYRDVVEHGLTEPEEVATATIHYRLTNDEVGRFITDRCLTGAAARRAVDADGDHYATATEAREGYMKWFCEQHPGAGRSPLGSKQFSQALDRLGYASFKHGDDIYRRPIVLVPDDEGGGG